MTLSSHMWYGSSINPGGFCEDQTKKQCDAHDRRFTQTIPQVLEFKIKHEKISTWLPAHF